MAHFSKLSSEQLASCIAHLSTPLREQLTQFVLAADFEACLSKSQVDKLLSYYPSNDTSAKHQLCRDLIPLAQSYSKAPISSFYVGAVAMGESDRIYFGANMEFKGMTLAQTVHAEQSVITNAWRHSETKLVMLAVSAPPCGHCRQFINELNGASDIDVLITEQPTTRFADILPMAFGPSDLGISDRLMNSPLNAISVESDDQFVNQTLQAAQQSYSPFSHSPSAVGLKTSQGTYFGRYAENCAYNPSLSPLQGALIALHLCGDDVTAIERAVLVEHQDSKVSQQKTTAQLLNLIANTSLETHLAK
ncbi:MAG: cytidine deaminase [Psychrobium sp.]